MGTTPGDERAIQAVMDRWKAAVDAHEPEQVADCFTEDAIFQGMHPYSVGRPGVAAYYASQPIGMRAAYKVLETRRPAEGLVLGYLWVDFSFTDKATGASISACWPPRRPTAGCSPTTRCRTWPE